MIHEASIDTSTACTKPKPENREMTSTALASYDVIDDTDTIPAEEPKPARKRRTRTFVGNDDSALGDDGSNQDKEAGEMAALMRDMANTAAKQAFELALKSGGEEAAKGVAEVMSKLKTESEKLREYMEQQSKLYAKPRNLCLHVRINDAPIKKLAMRVSPLLPDVMAQCKIGQRGMKWPLIMGPTGSGKTVLGRQLSEVLDVPFYAINGSEGVGESSLFGRWTKDGFKAGPVRKAAESGGVCLLDEYDAYNDNVLLSLNTWLASKVGDVITCPMSGDTFPIHENCYFMGAANSNGKGGDGVYTRNRLDGASLNRFAMFRLEYDRDLEKELCPDQELLDTMWHIREKLTEKRAGDMISTRDIVNAFHQKEAGFTMDKVLSCLRERFDSSNKELCVEKPASKPSKKKEPSNDIPF